MCAQNEVDSLRSFPPSRLPPGPGAVAGGRRYVAACLSRVDIDAAQIELALLLASEVVTNAVRHGSPARHVRVYLLRERIRVSVTDSSSAVPRMRTGTDPDEQLIRQRQKQNF